MINKDKLAIVLINWKKASITKQCLKNIEKNKYPSCFVILIENSSYNWRKYFKNFKFKIILIENKVNFGVAKSRNQGILKALSLNAKYIMFLDNDIFIKSYALKILIKIIKNSQKITGLGSILTYSDNKTICFAGGVFSYPLNLLFFKNLYKHIPLSLYPKLKKTSQIDYLWGGFALFKTDVFKKIGIFDESYGQYNMEDLDFCFRMKQKGLKVYLYGDNLAMHLQSAEQGNKIQDKISPKRAYFMAKNQFIFASKNLNGFPKIIFIISLLSMRLIWYLSITPTLTGKINYLRGMQAGIQWITKNK